MKHMRAYDRPSPKDCARILVDRLRPRGLTRDAAGLTLWLKDIAPSRELRQWFGREPQKWAEFQRRYRAEPDLNPAAVGQLCALRQGPAMLLYGAKDVSHNQAVALAAYMDATASR